MNHEESPDCKDRDQTSENSPQQLVSNTVC